MGQDSLLDTPMVIVFIMVLRSSDSRPLNVEAVNIRIKTNKLLYRRIGQNKAVD